MLLPNPCEEPVRTSLIGVTQSVSKSAAVQRPTASVRNVLGVDRRTTHQYLAANAVRKLQIGAGKNIRDGWLNTNWYPVRPFSTSTIFLDATRSFPLPDNSFDYVFSEHMIEHVPYEGGLNMLVECFRVLRPGGVLRIATPDMAFLTGLMDSDLSDLERSYIEWSAEQFLSSSRPASGLAVANNFLRAWGHTFIYDRATMRSALQFAGFVEVAERAVNESAEHELAGIDNTDRMPDGFLALESMTFEARKPPDEGTGGL